MLRHDRDLYFSAWRANKLVYLSAAQLIPITYMGVSCSTFGWHWIGSAELIGVEVELERYVACELCAPKDRMSRATHQSICTRIHIDRTLKINSLPTKPLVTCVPSIRVPLIHHNNLVEWTTKIRSSGWHASKRVWHRSTRNTMSDHLIGRLSTGIYPSRKTLDRDAAQQTSSPARKDRVGESHLASSSSNPLCADHNKATSSVQVTTAMSTHLQLPSLGNPRRCWPSIAWLYWADGWF